MRNLCYCLHLALVLMKAYAKTSPFLPFLFSQLLVPLIALHFHYLYSRIVELILFVRCVPLCLHLLLLLLLLHMLDGVLHNSSLENCLQSICLDLVLKAFLQVLSVFVLEQF